VHFLGWRNDSDAITSALDVVVQPSLWEEACSQAILEAMSMAKPLVVTRSGGNAELVQHGINGFVVAKHDLQAMASALNTLTADQALRREMGAEGLKLQQEQFTVETLAQAMERVYRSIIAAQSAVSQRMAS
jgi:glycosyltransferase involved in cell wall biosynthesis